MSTLNNQKQTKIVRIAPKKILTREIQMRDTVLRTTRAVKDRNQRLTVSQSSMLVTYWKRIWLRTMERRIQMLLKARKSTKFSHIELILEGQN